MGVKSPFFRRWFGEWRAHDNNLIIAVTEKGSERKNIANKDTGWNIAISGKVFSETQHRANGNQGAIPYLPYLEGIIKNAILFDTETIDREKSNNSVLMHSFYAIADIGNGSELLKLYVEEMYNPNLKDDTNRAYQLQNIEKKQSKVRSSQLPASSIIQTASVKTISDLYSLVKQYDKDFHPGKEVSPELLNAGV